MGGPVIERRGGSVVWVQRQNGTWWPGRILCSNEIPSSGTVSRTSFTSRFPIKLLGRDDASVYWYNLEKSIRVKAFRCGEFDGCIKKAESSKTFTYTKSLKYTHREDAILHALQLEKQDQEKLERPGHYALRPTKMSFKVISRPAVNKWKHKGEVQNQHFKSRSVGSTDERSLEFGFKTNSFETLSKDVSQKYQLSPGNSLPEDTSSQSVSSKFTTLKDSTKTLMDVRMTVQSTYRGEHTPLVSLMSRLNGKAIVGHPINIEVLYDSSMLPVKKESSHQLKNMSRMPQLVWRKSKRTPVCYTSSTSSAATNYENTPHSSKKFGDLSSQVRKNGPFNTKSRGKLSKKPTMSKNKPRTLYLADSRIKNAVKDNRLPCVACVPVKDIFIKLIGALGNV